MSANALHYNGHGHIVAQKAEEIYALSTTLLEQLKETLVWV